MNHTLRPIQYLTLIITYLIICNILKLFFTTYNYCHRLTQLT